MFDPKNPQQSIAKAIAGLSCVLRDNPDANPDSIREIEFRIKQLKSATEAFKKGDNDLGTFCLHRALCGPDYENGIS